MSDFLSNLAATALRIAPIAQPRTPALFEPRTVSNDVPLIETSEVEHVAVPPGQSSIETRRIEREHITRSNTISRSNTNVPDSTLSSEAILPRSDLRPSMIAIPVNSVKPMQATDPSGREEQSGRAEAARPVVEEISSQVATSRLVPRTSAREIINPKTERQMKEPQVEREAGEPHIHISIGRIEVRATTAPAPTRTTRREASILNLDDYLRQRR